MNNILVISAHIDDEVLGLGGTIALKSQSGNNVNLLSLCNRSTNHQTDDTEVTRLRGRLNEVTKILGIKETMFGNLVDEKVSLTDAIDVIEEAIDYFKPDTIFTHSDLDTNQDHRTVLHATSIASRTYSFNFVNSVYTYEVLSSTEQGAFYTQRFEPNVYVDISKVIDTKVKAMALYDKEVAPFPHPRSLKGIETLAKFRGMEIGVEYAEAFKLIRQKIE